MEKTLKTMILSTLTAGALALSAGCVAFPVEPIQPRPIYPQRVVVLKPAPIYPITVRTYYWRSNHHNVKYEHHEQRYEHHNGPFRNPTGNSHHERH